MDFLRRALQQGGGIWKGMGPGMRLVAVLATAFSLALIGWAYFWGGRGDYRVLYSGLTAEDAGAVTNALQAQAVPYRLEAGGTTVLVPADRLNQALVNLAVEGLPAKSGKGFELFDQTSLGMTPFTQHINYLRALQAELAKTIMQIEPIVFARVHIVRPDPSPFIRDQKPTTASVMLRLKPGMTLSRSVAAGIAALVARSVEALTPENVTLLDASGRVLSESLNHDTGAVSSQLDYRRALENYLASKAEDMLTRVLGSGRAIVRVAADINFQKLKERKESYLPDGRVISVEKITTSKTNSTGAGSRGPAGTASNLPGRTGAAGAGAAGGSNSTDETIETQFVVSKTIQELEDKLGTVDRLTIAAMVDLKGDTSQGGSGGPTMTAADVQDLIKQAIGFKAERDQIKVSEVQLAGANLPPSDDAQVETMLLWQNLIAIVRNGSLGIVALVGLALGWMVLRRIGPGTYTPGLAEEGPERKVRLERLSSVARENPEAFARAISAWLERPAEVRR
jgi:flagellar M-ring protein FliF